ncbi:hypothetical protein [Niallia nealsonii]|uniref:Uncharacterized protein n=1 Tax=Niallia nealsonii TaxID=115979 RepID=A0A2N0Z0W4_9BACI|nr:hypothetical protein [Niallia nealsonii]PKG23133.1 hypothetical protein CWS01_13775 [Niallia nealsonii]
MNQLISNLDLHAKGLWFPVSMSIILLLIVIFIPQKNITWKEIYITFGIIAFITWFCDGLIGRVFNLLDLGNPKLTGLGEIFCYTFIPTSLANLYLNYFIEQNKWKLAAIFIPCSLGIDIGMTLSGYMVFHGWSLIYSIIIYFFTYGFFLPLHIRFIRS